MAGTGGRPGRESTHTEGSLSSTVMFQLVSGHVTKPSRRQ